MTTFRRLFVEHWRGKLASLLVATAIWYLIKSHLEGEVQTFPVPGTSTPTTPRNPTAPTLDDTLLSPLTPPPIPGADIDD